MSMDEKKLIIIREYDSINDAEWDRSILEGAGIWATIQNEVMSALYPTGVMPAQLLIESSDKEKAMEVLEVYAK